MTSLTMRRVLAERFDINVGAHSYGSLLEPGMCDSHVDIGPYCSIGKNVRRYGASHPISSPSTHPYFYNPALGFVSKSADVERRHIIIGPDVWIGSNVTILPGCTKIGFGAVVGAGSVVTKNVPEFAIVVGNPARVVKYRHSKEKQLEILDSKYWELAPEFAQEIVIKLEADVKHANRIEQSDA
jgi:virginiamycin A acetyltransferase